MTLKDTALALVIIGVVFYALELYGSRKTRSIVDRARQRGGL